MFIASEWRGLDRPTESRRLLRQSTQARTVIQPVIRGASCSLRKDRAGYDFTAPTIT
jgi:hypothetical protein